MLYANFFPFCSLNQYFGKQWRPRWNAAQCGISSGPPHQYFGKQWRPRWNAAQCGISSGPPLFSKTKTIVREKNQYYLEIISCDSTILPFDNPQIILSNKNKESNRTTNRLILVLLTVGIIDCDSWASPDIMFCLWRVLIWGYPQVTRTSLKHEENIWNIMAKFAESGACRRSEDEPRCICSCHEKSTWGVSKRYKNCMRNSKWVWSGNTTITNCRQPQSNQEVVFDQG